MHDDWMDSMPILISKFRNAENIVRTENIRTTVNIKIENTERNNNMEMRDIMKKLTEEEFARLVDYDYCKLVDEKCCDNKKTCYQCYLEVYRKIIKEG